MQMNDDGRGYGSASPAHYDGPTSPAFSDDGSTSSSDRYRKGTSSANRKGYGAASPTNRKGRGSSARPVSHQGMQRRVPAERGISAYQHEHTTSQRNGATVRRSLRTVPLVPLEGTGGIPQRTESAQAVWSYVGDTEDIMPVAPTAPSFSTELNETINADNFIQPQAPLSHEITGVHHYSMGGRADGSASSAYYSDSGDNFTYLDSGDDFAYPDSGDDFAYPDTGSSSPRYRRAYGSISSARPQRNPDTDDRSLSHRYGRGDGSASPAFPVRTEALAAEIGYLPTTAPLGGPYDRLLPASALRRKRDTIFLMLLTLLVLSIID